MNYHIKLGSKFLARFRPTGCEYPLWTEKKSEARTFVSKSLAQTAITAWSLENAQVTLAEKETK